jgi:hypothetical protein
VRSVGIGNIRGEESLHGCSGRERRHKRVVRALHAFLSPADSSSMSIHRAFTSERRESTTVSQRVNGVGLLYARAGFIRMLFCSPSHVQAPSLLYLTIEPG